MRRPALLGSALAVSALLVGRAQSQTSPQTPTFRGGADLVLLDVSVLDKNHRPVRGLTAADFVVTVDGKTRPIVAFRAVELPPPSPILAGQASWVRTVAPDVTDNTRPAGRVVVILVDDATIEAGGLDPFAMDKARQAAYVAIDRLGPDDRAAVAFTKNGHTSQGFTSDRERLRRAVQQAVLLPNPDASDQQGDCLCGVCAIRALDLVARSLRDLPEQRKVILYISAGSLVWIPHPKKDAPTDPAEACNYERRDALHDALRQAQYANVTVNAIDPKGLTLGRQAMSARSRAGPPNNTEGLLYDPSTLRLEFLRTVTESTGGRAVVNSNDPDREVPGVLSESDAYYLLGVTPAEAPAKDGFHPMTVKVTRRDLEVRSRKGYYEETAKDREQKAREVAAGDLAGLLAAAMPDSAFPLTLSAGAFATDERQAIVAMTVGISSPRDARVDTEVVELVAGLVNPETGSIGGTRQQKIEISWKQPESARRLFEVMTSVPASPGRYELRVAVKTGNGRTASVYAPIEVPDFGGDLPVSGLVLNAAPALPSGGHAEIAEIVPAPPTTRRLFRTSDEVIAYLRVYRRERESAATVTTQLVNQQNETVGKDVQQVSGVYSVELPMSTLTPGEYLLTSTVTAGGQTVQRQLRFKVE